MTKSLLAVPHVSATHRTVPLAVASAGREAVELAEAAGLFLDQWQQSVLEDSLGERADGSWSAFEVGLIVPRQNGKGSVLEARELAGLFLFGEELILHSAHEYKTAAEAFLRIRSLIENTDDLRRRCKKPRTSHGEEGIELLNGNRLRFVARTGGSGRGFSGDCIILDEAYNLPGRVLAALFPTMSARPNPQIWYTSSAPLNDPTSDVLRGLCRRGRRGADKLAFLEWCAGPGDPEDRGRWRAANPGLGIRITEDFVDTERQAFSEDVEAWERERLGIWRDSEDGRERVIPPATWVACEDAKSGPVGRVAFALDVSPDRRTGAFGVVGASGRGGTHGEVADYGTGTEWMVARAKQLQDKWMAPLAVAAGSPAASLLADLENAGVKVTQVTTGDHAAACGALFDEIVQQRFRHLGQLELNAAVEGADRRYYGDSWLWSRRTSVSDICPLVAVTLAKWAFDQGPAFSDPTVSVW